MDNKTPKPKPGACPKRKRGGQAGNHNAFKHGFYAQDFTRQREGQPGQDILSKLEEEEALLTGFIQRVVTTMPEKEIDYEQALAGLQAINLALGRKNAIRRTREINEALAGAWEAMQILMDIHPGEE